MITLSGKSRKLKACRISARYLFARAFLRTSGRGSQLVLLPDANRLKNTCQVHGGITTLSLLPVIFISNGEVFRMTTETIVCFLFWYMYAGSCSARLHRSRLWQALRHRALHPVHDRRHVVLASHPASCNRHCCRQTEKKEMICRKNA